MAVVERGSDGEVFPAGTRLVAAPGAIVIGLVKAAPRGSSEVMIAHGEAALDGSNPTPIATGLTTVIAVALTLSGSAAPGVGTSELTYTISGGTVNVYGWKVTASGDATLIASTGTETFSWIAVGF